MLAEEGNVATNSFGFTFGAFTETESFGVGLGTHRIAPFSGMISTTIDNTVFHDYRLEATPGTGYQLYVDDNLVASGLPRRVDLNDPTAMQFLGAILLGDGTGGTNARADVTFFRFCQPGFAVHVDAAASGTQFPSSSQDLISGHAVSETANHSVSRKIVNVTVNGTPVDALDATGNFFTRVHVAPGQNDFEIIATDVGGITDDTSLTLEGVQPPSGEIDFSIFSDVSASFAPDYARTSFNQKEAILHADWAIRNAGQYPADSPLYVGVTNISDPRVRVHEPVGLTPDGIPYFDFTPLVPGGRLSPNETTGTASLSFFNPEQIQFNYDLVFFGMLNRAPTITSVPDIEALVDRPYSYDVEATDPDGDDVSYSLISGPTGSVIDHDTGLISWNPATADMGTHAITVRAEDGRGGSTEQRYVLSVIQPPPNRPPMFTSVPVVSASVNTPYSYDADAIDPDVDPLAYSLLTAPVGMSIDPFTGVITWAPTPDQMMMPSAPTNSDLSLPLVPGFTVDTYANVADPIEMSFDPLGNLYVGGDRFYSGGTPTDPSPVHRIGPRGSPVGQWGNTRINDPDTVLFDATGAYSGTPGALLVGGLKPGSSTEGQISAILPDQTVKTVVGPSSVIGNIGMMTLDQSGRLLFITDRNPGRSDVLAVSPTGTVSVLRAITIIDPRLFRVVEEIPPLSELVGQLVDRVVHDVG